MPGSGGGGGIFNNGGLIFVDNTTVSGNQTEGDGGGISALAGSQTNVDSSALIQNHGVNGGGFFNAGNGTISDSVIVLNEATDGGGIFTDLTGTTNVEDSVLINNSPNDEN